MPRGAAPVAVEAQDQAGVRLPLCPGFRRFVAEVEAIYAGHTAHGTVAEERRLYGIYSARFLRPRPSGLTVDDVAWPLPGRRVTVRVYRPRAAHAADALPPCVVFIHGGGWVLGSIDTHDCIAAEIAAATGAVVASIDYRLAPEHPFPAGFEDCRDVVRAIASGASALAVDPARVVLAGDSAGANLAAAVCLALRGDSGVRLAGQVLIYPVLGAGFEMPSHSENATAPMLKTAEMRRFWRTYLGGRDTTESAFAAPLLAGDLAGLPPAFIATAGHDPARDDGAAFADRLRAAGGEATYRCAGDLAHGYLRARTLSVSASAEFAAITGAIERFASRAR